MVNDMALKRAFIFVFAVFILYLPCGQVEGIVLHPETEPNLVTWTERPGDGVVGMRAAPCGPTCSASREQIP